MRKRHASQYANFGSLRKVNQLFDIYSIFDSQYIVCFQEKAFHSSVHCGDRFLERTEILNLDSTHIVVI